MTKLELQRRIEALFAAMNDFKEESGARGAEDAYDKAILALQTLGIHFCAKKSVEFRIDPVLVDETYVHVEFKHRYEAVENEFLCTLNNALRASGRKPVKLAA